MSKRLRPMFSYFGSKWRLSSKYPTPTKDIIIEPFAGSACFSLYYPDKQIKLFDKYDKVCVVWDYLIHVSESELSSLPILKKGEQIPLSLSEGARYLIGFWVSKATTSPRLSMSKSSVNSDYIFWGEPIKQRIMSQLKYIRHWTIEQASYEDIPNTNGYWFVDPPYQVMGKYYKHNNIDYDHLSNWCQSRNGEVVVCENNGSTWLPFKTLHTTKSFTGLTKEVYWSNK